MEPLAVGAAINRLGSALLRGVGGTATVVLGPSSVYSVLGLALIGARGSTATALAEVLGPDAGQVLTALGEELDAAIRTAGDRPVTLTSAEAVFLASRLHVRPEFRAGVGPDAVHPTDFQADPEGARATVDRWVAERTEDRITDLLAPGTVRADTMAILVNAVYFAAPWAAPLQRQAGALPFTTADGATVDVDLLLLTRNLRCARGRGWQAVSVPYAGARLAFTVVLPDDGEFAAVGERLDADLLAAATAGRPEHVSVRMPPLSIRTPIDLTGPLRDIGLADLLDPACVDLSGIAGDPGDLRVSVVAHQALVELDEHGTVAAAATALVMRATAMRTDPPRPIVVDRPYYFLIHDTTTGAALFLGQVTDPR